MSTRGKRILQLFLTGLFAFVALTLIVGGAARGNSAQMAAGCIPLIMAAAFYWIFETQLRSYARAGAEVKANIERCAKAVFDAPARMLPGYDIEATMANAFLAGFAREADNDAAFTTEGTFGDAKVSVASHVSVMGRQIGEFHHTYSHVLVDVLGLTKPFRITREGAGAKLAKAVGAVKEVRVGDEAFDKTFMIEAESELAKAVLDESIRERLFSLQSKVKNVSSDAGVGCMSLTLTNRGLALRWPGDMTPELAAFIRDLLIDMRTNMLAHENRTAARIGAEATAGAGYRVAADDAEDLAQEEAEAEAKARNAG